MTRRTSRLSVVALFALLCLPSTVDAFSLDAIEANTAAPTPIAVTSFTGAAPIDEQPTLEELVVAGDPPQEPDPLSDIMVGLVSLGVLMLLDASTAP